MLTSQCLRIGDLEARILGGESGDEIVQRVFPVLDDLVDLHAGETLLVVIHGGAILATLGSIAPGRTGLPSDDNPYNLDSDLVGGRPLLPTPPCRYLESRSACESQLKRPAAPAHRRFITNGIRCGRQAARKKSDLSRRPVP